MSEDMVNQAFKAISQLVDVQPNQKVDLAILQTVCKSVLAAVIAPSGSSLLAREPFAKLLDLVPTQPLEDLRCGFVSWRSRPCFQHGQQWIELGLEELSPFLVPRKLRLDESPELEQRTAALGCCGVPCPAAISLPATEDLWPSGG